MNSVSPNEVRPPGLTRSQTVLALAQTVLGSVAVGMAYLSGVKFPGWLFLIWPVLCGIVCGLLPPGRGQGARIWLGSALVATLCAWGAYFLGARPSPGADEVNAWAASLLALALGLGGRRPSAGTGWLDALAAAWALAAGGLWLSAGYSRNRPVLFFLGLAVEVAALIAIRIRFRPSAAPTQVLYTLILLLLGLPLIDLCLPRSALPQPRVPNEGNAVRTGGYPLTGFARWWNRYLEQWALMGRAIFVRDPERVYPFRLRPHSDGRLFDSRIHINRLGLRGPDLSPEKGRAYRILALGESTTFGCTLRPEDSPWPDLLQRLIVERLHPDRPVEVINAGTPSYHLGHNLRRLRRELLSLQPDLIVSYHGFNGFGLFDPRFLDHQGASPPVFEPRPLDVLARFEYRLKLLAFRRWEDRVIEQAPPLSVPPYASEYGQAYRGLVELAHAHRIGLALCNFSMAVRRTSPAKTVDFYREVFPLVRWQIQANELHTELVRRIAAENPQVALVDTQLQLDGQSAQFIDLVHLTQEGRRRLAENIFAGIADRLRAELSQR